MTPRVTTTALVCLGATVLAVVALGGCGGDSEGSGSRTLTWFVAIQPGGTIEEVAKRCSEESNGQYEVEAEFLPTDASQQREQLVRRLGAEDPSIDIVGMDVIWTGEFANAGWVEEWKGPLKKQVTEKVFPNVIETASFEGKLYAAPFNTNTQLLWYRKDLVPKPPRTWDEMIDQAEGLGREAGTIQVQANRYEGFMVWANALIESAGTPILSGPEAVDLERGPDRKGARGDGPAGQLLRRAAEPLDLRRGHRPARLRGGRIGLHDQLHLRLRERPGRSAGHRQRDGLRPLPPGRGEPPSKPPLGGFNLAVSSFSENKDVAFEAAACLANEQEPADRGRTRRPAALALRPLHRQSRDRGLPRLRRSWSKNRSRAPARGRPRPPTRTSRWRSSARCTRRTRSTPKTPARSTTN